MRELERETAEANRLSELVRQFNEERGTIQRLLADAGCPTNEPSQGIGWLARELSKRTDDLYNELTEQQRQALVRGDLVECDSCAARAGTPTLCASCLANRYLISAGSRETPRRRRRQLMRALSGLRALIARGGVLIIQRGQGSPR